MNNLRDNDLLLPLKSTIDYLISSLIKKKECLKVYQKSQNNNNESESKSMYVGINK